jgi:hypothetical protein
MKILISALLAASTLLSAATMPFTASAQEAYIQRGHDRDFGRPKGPPPGFDRDHRSDNGRNNDKHKDRDLAIGIIGGLAAGAIIGGAINDQPHRYPPPPPPRFEPRRDYYSRPMPPRYPPRRPIPEYRGDPTFAVQPWSRQWRDFCSNRYRTFNPSTGTYLGGDGKWHFCTIQ